MLLKRDHLASFASPLEVLDHHAADLFFKLISQSAHCVKTGAGRMSRLLSVRVKLDDPVIVIRGVNERVVEDQHKCPTWSVVERALFLRPARDHRKQNVLILFRTFTEQFRSVFDRSAFQYFRVQFSQYCSNCNSNRLDDGAVTLVVPAAQDIRRKINCKLLCTDLSTTKPLFAGAF